MEVGFILKNAWLIPGIPLCSFLVTALLSRPRTGKVAGLVGTLAMMTSAACSALLAWQYFHVPGGEAGAHPSLIPWSMTWLPYQESLIARVGVLVDPISVLLMVVVTTVSSLVHLYSIGYMQGEKGFGRYFTYLSLFTFSMLGLVVSPNILQIYVCWELVGVSSFLLIGYYYERPSAVAACKKAFIVTRFADLGFFIGVLVLGYYGYSLFGEVSPALPAGTQPFDFAYLTSPAFLERFQAMTPHFLGMSLITLAMVLVFMGAAGKSAMFPLHIWLPDAMEGPTPVSALIHAATMVVAGVYLVARMFPVFAASGTALDVVAVVGAFTALFAAVIGCTQDDIKRVLAFSTLSQLGYMMFALGVSTMEESLGYTASMFHLFTHAFFKALLFLGAGALIHAVHSNSIWDMGGLARKMPITHATFLVATLAIAGIWPFAGFFSKDEILAAAIGHHHYVIFGIGLLVAGMTAFYMCRIYFLAFWGSARSKHADHAHEAPWVMLAPLIILAVLSLFSGFIPMREYVSIGAAHEGHEGINMAIAIPSLLMAACGIGLAWFLYGGSTTRVEALASGLGRVYTVIKRKFLFDELYIFITKSMIFRCVAAPVAWFDRHVVDGGVNLAGWITCQLGAGLRYLQTGQVQTYAAWLAGGSIAIVLFWWALGI
jgi:NADH-quinone oxidoreductase subunit L